MFELSSINYYLILFLLSFSLAPSFAPTLHLLFFLSLFSPKFVSRGHIKVFIMAWNIKQLNSEDVCDERAKNKSVKQQNTNPWSFWVGWNDVRMCVNAVRASGYHQKIRYILSNVLFFDICVYILAIKIYVFSSSFSSLFSSLREASEWFLYF